MLILDQSVTVVQQNSKQRGLLYMNSEVYSMLSESSGDRFNQDKKLNKKRVMMAFEQKLSQH